MTEIPDKMFQNNTSLKKVVVPASVTKVGTYAFSSSRIEEIYFEDSANGLTVGAYAFYNCPDLTSLRLPYGLTSIGASAISKTGLETIVIPDTVTEMGGSALAYNDALKNVTLSKSLTAVPSRGFVGCEALTELTPARLHPGLRRQQHRQCLHRLREPAEHLRGRRLPVLQERGRRPVR